MQCIIDRYNVWSRVIDSETRNLPETSLNWANMYLRKYRHGELTATDQKAFSLKLKAARDLVYATFSEWPTTNLELHKYLITYGMKRATGAMWVAMTCDIVNAIMLDLSHVQHLKDKVLTWADVVGAALKDNLLPYVKDFRSLWTETPESFPEVDVASVEEDVRVINPTFQWKN